MHLFEQNSRSSTLVNGLAAMSEAGMICRQIFGIYNYMCALWWWKDDADDLIHMPFLHMDTHLFLLLTISFHHCVF